MVVSRRKIGKLGCRRVREGGGVGCWFFVLVSIWVWLGLLSSTSSWCEGVIIYDSTPCRRQRLTTCTTVVELRLQKVFSLSPPGKEAVHSSSSFFPSLVVNYVMCMYDGTFQSRTFGGMFCLTHVATAVIMLRIKKLLQPVRVVLLVSRQMATVGFRGHDSYPTNCCSVW